VDLLTISHSLGHGSLATTNRLAKVDLEMKRKAIARVNPVPRQRRTTCDRNHTVLDWLEPLQALKKMEVANPKDPHFTGPWHGSST
jgi:hypothetical protein